MSQDVKNEPTSQTITEMLSQSDKPLIVQVGKTTIVGEIHIRTKQSPEIDRYFSQSLSESGIVVTEHQCSPNDFYSKQSSEKRFMLEAQEHSVEQKKSLLVLDNEIYDRYQIWLEAGIDLSRDDFNFLFGIHSVLSDFSNGANQSTILENLAKLYEVLTKNSDYSKKMAVATYLSVISDTEIEKIDEKTQMVVSFAKIDAQAREIHYQNRLVGIQKNIGDKSMIIIVGKDHVRPIEKALTDQNYRTPLDISAVDILRKKIVDLKKRTNFDRIINS